MSDKSNYELLDKIKYSILERIALILLIIFTINPFVKVLRVAFAYLTSSIVGNSMYYTAPFLFIALGMGYVTNKDEEKAIEENLLATKNPV